MGYIEDLRRQKAEEEIRAAIETTDADEQERIRLQEHRRVNARNDAEREASTRALRSSIVPKIAQEFAGLLNERLYPDCQPNRDSLRMDISSGYEIKRHSRGNDEIIFESQALIIEGQLDGSVKVGDRVLSASEAKIPEVVETALETAYRHPKLIKHRRQVPRGTDYGGWIEDHPQQ